MSFTVPTYSSLYTSVLSDLQNKLGIANIIGKVVLKAIAAVQAAKLKIFYLSANIVQNNVYPDLADEEMLIRFGKVRLGRSPNPATAGEYTVNVSGVIGATIAPGTTLKSMDTSTSPDKTFTLDTEYTFTGTTGTISIRALEGGTDSELTVGDQLQFTAPIANVDSFCDVDSVDVIPADEESISEYRQDVLDSFVLEPQGGARADYRLWAADATAIRTVYPYAKVGSPGEITLYVESEFSSSTDGHGTPTAAQLAEVEEVIELDPDTTKDINERGRRPMGVFDIDVTSVLPLPVDVDIVNLSGGSLTSIQTAIEAVLYDIRPYIDGLDDANNLNKNKLYESAIYNAILDSIGGSETFDSITVEVSGTPITSYTFTDGYIPYLDTLTQS